MQKSQIKMPNASGRKGYRGEAEVVQILRDLGFNVQRAYGSDGRALGEKSDIDVKATKGDITLLVQVKRRKKIANYLKFNNANVIAVRQDRGPWVYMLSEEIFRDVFQTEMIVTDDWDEEPDDSMADAEWLASAGWGTDEDYQ